MTSRTCFLSAWWFACFNGRWYMFDGLNMLPGESMHTFVSIGVVR